MGADTMISILTAAPWLQSAQYRLILQCQSKTPSLRSYLSESGWRIAEETVVRDGRFLYTVMEVWWEPSYPKLTPAECYFPPALLENPALELPAYYQWVVDGLKISAAHKEELQPILEALLALPQNPSLSWLADI
jgi:tRNA A22 N-methylase